MEELRLDAHSLALGRSVVLDIRGDGTCTLGRGYLSISCSLSMMDVIWRITDSSVYVGQRT